MGRGPCRAEWAVHTIKNVTQWGKLHFGPTVGHAVCRCFSVKNRGPVLYAVVFWGPKVGCDECRCCFGPKEAMLCAVVFWAHGQTQLGRAEVIFGWAVLGFIFFVVGSAGISSRDRAARYAVVFWHVGRCVFVVGRDGISPRDGAARVTVCIS